MILFGLPEAWFSPRLTLGLGNPNTAGALLAMLLVSGLPFCLGGGKRRALGALLAVIFALGIAMTASRGALVAMAVGLVVLGVTGTRRRGDRIFLAAVAVAVAAIFSVSPAGRRLHVPGDDASLASRTPVFAQVPAMVAAAPGGWGAGRSAEAYQNWFEIRSDGRPMKHMLSTHAIWLVERGWPVRLLYVATWLVAIGWCAGAGPRWMSGGTACWTAFAVAACFSHVGERAIMWALPVAWCGLGVVARWGSGRSPSARALMAVALGALVVVGGITLAGRPWAVECALRDGVVRLKGVNLGEAPKNVIAVVADGRFPLWLGKQIRGRVPARTTVEYLWEPGAEISGDAAFFAGRAAVPRLRPGTVFRRVVWASPEGILPWELPEAVRCAPITVLYGEMAPYTDAPWRKYFEDGGAGRLVIFPGEGGMIMGAWSRALDVLFASP